MKIIFNILKILFVVFLIILCGKIISRGFLKHELIECQEWKKQSENYVDWYSTIWQDEQCKQFGIEF